MQSTAKIYPWTTAFLIYVNNLPGASDLLNAIMFADDTNLFFEPKGTRVLYLTLNTELQNINGLF